MVEAIALSLEDTFVASVAKVASGIRLDPLRMLFRELTPPCVGWGVELTPRHPQGLPDFGCVVPSSLDAMHWPHCLRTSPAFVALRSLIGPECVNGSWFFEFDANGDAYGVPHSFARLTPDCRTLEAVGRRLASSAALTRGGGRCATCDAAAFVLGLPDYCLVSDFGVVIRSGVTQLRLGIAAPTDRLPGLLSDFPGNADTSDDISVFVRRCEWLPRHCILQVAFADDTLSPRITGLELSCQEDGRLQLSRLCNWLTVRTMLPEWLARTALAWPGCSRLMRTGLAWPRILSRVISHIKITFEHRGPIRAKVYLTAGEVDGIFV